jgi:hypothetical protein
MGLSGEVGRIELRATNATTDMCMLTTGHWDSEDAQGTRDAGRILNSFRELVVGVQVPRRLLPMRDVEPGESHPSTEMPAR